MRMRLAAFALACGLAVVGQPAEAQNLTAADVDLVVSRAVQEAAARGAAATIAVSDRVGNVLGVFQMAAAAGSTISVGSTRIPAAGIQRLENIPNGIIPAEYGAIAKAITGSYLSSAGNAFTTRTASQIVQEFFNVGERAQPAGPLFGVQFSSLTCSDLVNASAYVAGSAATSFGPKRSPLGLSADPGGLPLYKGGVVVGGIGVIADNGYNLDLRIQDYDRNVDELVAIAGQVGFQPSIDITAQRITVDGKTLRYSDVSTRHLASNPSTAPLTPGGGAYLAAIPGYRTSAGPDAGTTYGAADSGYVPDPDGIFGASPTPFVLVNGAGVNRFSPIGQTGAFGVAADGTTSGTERLDQADMVALLTSALQVAYSGRAQIRKPLGSFIQVTISLVDVNGSIMGVVRTPDGPVFGTDVSLQKARSALYFSHPAAAAELSAIGAQSFAGGAITTPALLTYVNGMRSFFGPTALANGIAYGARSIGNVHRPFFPDGAAFGIPGPLSTDYSVWSPFNVGLQLDLVLGNILNGLDLSGAGIPPSAEIVTPPATGCTAVPPRGGATRSPLANGAQIFAGGVPVFKNGILVGGIGVSGDGIDQDDMIAFLGTHNAGVARGNGLGNAPIGQRANTLKAFDRSLRYVSCPFAPFLGSKEQDPCGGK